jgi:WD40 repeat protein
MEPHCLVAPMSLPATRVQKTRAIIPHQKFEGHTSFVEGVLHLRDGQRIMTCSPDGSLRVWDMESGKQIGEDWRDDEGTTMNTIALSPDGKKVLSGGGDGTMRLWDIDAAKVIAKWTGHTADVRSLCWNGDGRRVVCGANDGIRVWDAETGDTILGPLEFGGVHAVVYSPDKTTIAAGGNNDSEGIGSIKIWNANTGKLVKNHKPAGPVYSLAWPGEGNTLISGSNEGKIEIWNTTTWQQIAVLTGHTNSVYGIAISPNGRVLASASCDTTARLWNLDDGQPISLPLQHAHDLHCLSFSEDGKVLATGCWDHNAYTWDVSAVVREAGLDELFSHSHVSLHF